MQVKGALYYEGAAHCSCDCNDWKLKSGVREAKEDGDAHMTHRCTEIKGSIKPSIDARRTCPLFLVVGLRLWHFGS